MRTDRPLLTRRGLLWGAWACLLTGLAFVTGLLVNRAEPSLGGLFNDFADCWAAARVLDLGGDPYDKHLLGQVIQQAGLRTTIGTGYSSPLLLGEVLRPLGILPALAAGALFGVPGDGAAGRPRGGRRSSSSPPPLSAPTRGRWCAAAQPRWRCWPPPGRSTTPWVRRRGWRARPASRTRG